MAHTRHYNEQKARLFAEPYSMTRWELFDYSRLQYINTIKRPGKATGDRELYNDCFIMADTETSKKSAAPGPCHVVAWTISIRAYHENLVTLYGSRPDDFCKCLSKIKQGMPADNLIIYFHNLAYDWCFLRKFIMAEFGTPHKQLNVKTYYPISIRFKNNLQIRDSLILAQRSLEKWAEDMDVVHKKAVGSWDYDKIRDQSGIFIPEELHYIENDTLAGVECLDATMILLRKHVYSMPYTATGIPRDECRKRGKKKHAHDLFKKCCPTWDLQMMLEMLFHGGYTHANKNTARWVQDCAICMDFASSYPYSMLSSRFPMSEFKRFNGKLTIDDVRNTFDKYAYMFMISIKNLRLKDPGDPMPMLQMSKTQYLSVYSEDNGRIMSADACSIIFNEYDLMLFVEQYDYEELYITDISYAYKDYLPRWFTDYVYELFKDKSELKGVDPVLYGLKKGTLNSTYGMCVQKPVKIDIVEDYDTGLYEKDYGKNLEEKYIKYTENYNNVLCYAWGVWVTSESMYRLYQLSKCIDYENGGVWLYSDTDSIYASKWNEDKLKAFNDNIRQKLTDRGYPPIVIEGKEYCLGVAEFDGAYSEFIALGSKRYCCRYSDDPRNKKKDIGKLKITVAGVPKKGVEQLQDDINNFVPGMTFKGELSGKKQHTYYFLPPGEDPYIDDKGNLTGDSIDLGPCDYKLGTPYEELWLTDEKGYLQLELPYIDELDIVFE